jgi:glutamate-5-semialdehyde dehydrogenase
MTELEQQCRTMAVNAKMASRMLAEASTAEKDAFLLAAADALLEHQQEVLTANAADVRLAPEFGLNPAAIDRLTLTPTRIAAVVEGLRQIAQLPDPVGEILEGRRRPNGLEVQKVRVPLGVIFFLYESRPNVTVDAAGLCVKSGNAVILRGGKEALQTNTALVQCLIPLLEPAGLPPDAIQYVPTVDRDAVGHFLGMPEQIDLVIPRGGASLIQRVAAEARMPVLKHYQGNCHIFVDASADLSLAERIILNAKCQRPGVCNAMETLLVHEEMAEIFLPRVGRSLLQQGVQLRGCSETCRLIPQAVPASEQDYWEEFLDLILAVKVVSDLDSAVEHIARYGSGHTEAIITRDLASARRFSRVVDAAAVVINASTRFHDGFELGLGAEIGISTDKFHARGPCGLRELTSYKYILQGDGQTRE